MKIAHIIPALKPGGPVQALKSLLHHLSDWSHQILALDPMARGADLIELGQLGGQVVRGASAEAIGKAAIAADVALIHFYNQPQLLQTLAGPLPEARWAVWHKVGGQAPPQLFFPERYDDKVTCAFTAQCEAARQGGWPVIPSMVQERYLALERRAHDGLLIDYIGSMNMAKLHRDAIKRLAAVRHPDLRIRFFGGPLDDDMARDLALAPNPERFEVGGYIHDTAAVLAETDIFVAPMAPGSYASSDLALQEAMHAGIAPVVWGQSGPAFLLESGIDGAVAASGEDFTNAVQTLCDDPDLRERIGAAAKRTAMTKLAPAANALRMAQFLESRAKERKGPLGWTTRSELTPATVYLMSQGIAEDEARGMIENEDRLSLEAFAKALTETEARVEGGLIQWRNTHPGDPHLRSMSAAWHVFHGEAEIAVREYSGLKA